MLAQNATPAPWPTMIIPLLNLAVTAILAVVTWYYAVLTRRLVRAQTDPYVVVYVHHDMSLPSMLQIVIENLGHGVAEDVRFELSDQLPMRAFERDEAKAPLAAVMDIGPLIQGIPALGPSGKRIIAWGEFGGLHKFLGDKAVTVVTRYKYRGKDMPAVTSKLEVGSFVIENATDTDSARQSALQLNRIASALENLAKSGSHSDVVEINSEEIE